MRLGKSVGSHQRKEEVTLGPEPERKAHATVTLEVTVSGEFGNRVRRELAPGIAWFNIGGNHSSVEVP